MPIPTVLLVSDDSTLIQSCREVVRPITNLEFEVCPRLSLVPSRMQTSEFALVLVHMVRAPDVDQIISLLRQLAATSRPVATIVIGDQENAEKALMLLRQGAADYLSRPLDLARFAYLIDTLTVRARFASRSAYREMPARAGSEQPMFFVKSAAMKGLMDQLKRVAPQDTTVMLGGETGTGKTRVARLIHDLSERASQPFMVVNCGALSANLIESEMFGHVRGAFTGADRDRVGKFTEVGRGTLLLDEIDAFPLALQHKLLRAVEERIFEPVGSNKSQPMQARLIVASNCDLLAESAAGRFRLDLYYRLNVMSFYMPPLREREDLIRPFVAKLIADFANGNGSLAKGITPQAMAALERYAWPGNIRELRNVVERAIVLCANSEIDLVDLPDSVTAFKRIENRVDPSRCLPGSSAGARLENARGLAEAVHIEEVLSRNKNNRLRAAAELGISRMTLYKKLQKYGLATVNCAAK
jgi:DNA-binding NtrC family response regulator